MLLTCLFLSFIFIKGGYTPKKSALPVKHYVKPVKSSQNHTPSAKKENTRYPNPYPFKCKISKIINVYDGDSIYVELDDSHPVAKALMIVFSGKVGLRLNRIDTAEITAKNKKEAELAQWQKEFAQNIFNNASGLDCEIVCLDKYNKRVVAEVWLTYQGKRINFSDYMLRYGKAKPYDGGKKEKWF
jgi:endonuclease YncB( thermonuclease family)